MNIPQGQLIRRRVLNDVGTVLASALDRELTGYARLEPQDTLLLDADGVGVLIFDDGIPVAAYHTGTDTKGPDAVTDIGSRGPYRLELYELEPEIAEQIYDSDALRVPPGLPANQLSGDTELRQRTRDRAPTERIEDETDGDDRLASVEQFLDNDDKVETIRERAQEEAKSRADEWNLPTDSE